MQLFVRQAGAQRTVVVEAHPHDCFELIAERLASTATATSSAEVVSCQSTCMLPLRTVLRPSPVLSRDSLQTFEFKGRTYPQGTSLASAGVQSGDFIALYQRWRGGGGDGGSTGAESRSSFLEMYATKKAAKVTLLIVQNGVCARQHFQTWSLQVNPVEAKLAKWTQCNLSGEALQPPCVADELGNLYNKDAMVQALVTKSLPASLSYISTLKHLIDLRYCTPAICLICLLGNRLG